MARLKRAAKRAPLKLSAVAGIGVTDALGGLLQTIDQRKRETAEAEAPPWHP